MKTDVINKLNATEWIIIDNHVTTEVKNNEMYRVTVTDCLN